VLNKYRKKLAFKVQWRPLYDTLIHTHFSRLVFFFCFCEFILVILVFMICIMMCITGILVQKGGDWDKGIFRLLLHLFGPAGDSFQLVRLWRFGTSLGDFEVFKLVFTALLLFMVAKCNSGTHIWCYLGFYTLLFQW
jgi:hypothetical protein